MMRYFLVGLVTETQLVEWPCRGQSQEDKKIQLAKGIWRQQSMPGDSI
jgi:hypothetical protein